MRTMDSVNELHYFSFKLHIKQLTESTWGEGGDSLRIILYPSWSCENIFLKKNLNYDNKSKNVWPLIFDKHFIYNNNKQELQEVLKFPIEIFWNLEARLTSKNEIFCSSKVGFGRFTKKIRMVAVLMTERFNFTSIEEKTSSSSLSYKKNHKRQNDLKGRYTSANLLENSKKVKIEVTGPKKVNF